jgi:hypothetical protein
LLLLELFLDELLFLDEPLSADFEELSLPLLLEEPSPALEEPPLLLLEESPPLLFEEPPPALEEPSLLSEEPPLLSEEPPLAPEEFSLLLTFFLSPVLKSVSYHPLPFNLNATLEISFFSSGLSQSGHSFSKSSLSF